MFVGHGVYLKTSIMSHSCIANTKTIMNEDLTVDVRAVTAIKRGTEITKSYVSSMEPTQVHIYSNYSSHISTYLHIYSGAPGEAGGWLVFPVPVSPLLRSSRGSRLLQLGGLLEMQVCICIGYYIFTQHVKCKISSHSQSPGRASSCPPTRWTARLTGRAGTAARASPRTPSGS